MVQEYFETLRWLNETAQLAASDALTRRAAAMTVIYSVTAVEVFLNLWFRVYAVERSDMAIRSAFDEGLSKKISLEQKLAQWPGLILNRKLNLKAGPGGAFVALKTERNSIVHFESTNDTLHASNIIIHNLANTSQYDALSAKSAANALETAEALVAEIFRIADFDDETSQHAQAIWIGKVQSGVPIEKRPAPWIAPYVTR